jgi:hypothetical protein
MSTPRPVRFISGEKDIVPILKEAGGPQGRYERGRKISPPSGFHPRTVQPVASRYTYYATLALPSPTSVRNVKHTISPFQGRHLEIDILCV